MQGSLLGLYNVFRISAAGMSIAKKSRQEGATEAYTAVHPFSLQAFLYIPKAEGSCEPPMSASVSIGNVRAELGGEIIQAVKAVAAEAEQWRSKLADVSKTDQQSSKSGGVSFQTCGMQKDTLSCRSCDPKYTHSIQQILKTSEALKTIKKGIHWT